MKNIHFIKINQQVDIAIFIEIFSQNRTKNIKF
mgnify:CR=1 FL=1